MTSKRIKSAKLKREPSPEPVKGGGGGRKPIYRAEFVHTAAVLTAKGLTCKDMAQAFGVSDATIEIGRAHV